MSEILTWIESHRQLLTILAIASAVVFVGSLIAVPMIVARLPVEFFERRLESNHLRHRRLWLIVIENVVGYSFIFAGILMLVLPGQGLLTIFVGLLLADFPAKERLERRLLRTRAVQRGLNWLRRRLGRAAFRFESKHSPKSP